MEPLSFLTGFALLREIESSLSHSCCRAFSSKDTIVPSLNSYPCSSFFSLSMVLLNHSIFPLFFELARLILGICHEGSSQDRFGTPTLRAFSGTSKLLDRRQRRNGIKAIKKKRQCETPSLPCLKRTYLRLTISIHLDQSFLIQMKKSTWKKKLNRLLGKSERVRYASPVLYLLLSQFSLHSIQNQHSSSHPFILDSNQTFVDKACIFQLITIPIQTTHFESSVELI